MFVPETKIDRRTNLRDVGSYFYDVCFLLNVTIFFFSS